MRSTPARSASSATIRVPPVLTLKTRPRSEERCEVVPATWKTRSTPGERLAHRVAFEDVALGDLELEIAEVLGARGIAEQQPQLVAALGERPGEVRAEEAARARYQRLGHAVMVRR